MLPYSKGSTVNDLHEGLRGQRKWKMTVSSRNDLFPLTVVVACCWSIRCYDLKTTVWSVIRSLSFLSIVVTNAIGVLFVKLKR